MGVGILERRIIGAIMIVSGMTLLVLASVFIYSFSGPSIDNSAMQEVILVALPEPRFDSVASIEAVLMERRSIREYNGEALALQDVSQLLWSAQGITDPRGYRTAPSAGGLYPLEVYLVAGDVENLEDGVYKYWPQRHELVKLADGDKRKELSEASLGQTWVNEAAVNLVIVGVYERTTVKYGDRGIQYVHLEAGHAAQNVCLQATALKLGTVTIGAFHDELVQGVLGAPDNEKPLYVMPVGKI